MIEKLMFSLIGNKVFGNTVEQADIEKLSEQGVLSQLYKMSAHHDMAHIVGAALSEINIKGKLAEEDKTNLLKFDNEFMKAVFRHAGIDFELKRVCQALEEAKIPFIPLKGAVIKELYPEPWMRTSSDVDILVQETDFESAEAQLSKKLKYTVKERSSHDASFYAESGVHVELHFDLVEEGRANFANKVLKNVWEYVRPVENWAYRCELIPSVFYFYHIAHMAKHFQYGGTGVRPILDLKLLDSKLELCAEERDSMLEEGKLLAFSNYIRELSLVWFSCVEPTRMSDMLQEYILAGGAYGSFENRVAVRQKKKGGKLGYIFSCIWIPYNMLKFRYPILKKHKWLYPFYQMRRWLGLLFSGKFFRACREFKANNQLPRERAIVAEELLEKMELV